MIRLTRTLEEERFQEYRKLAQQSLADDYLWLRAHAGCYEWMATKQWLIEFVYNANLLLLQVDEMQNPVPLKRLYRELFEALDGDASPSRGRPEQASPQGDKEPHPSGLRNAVLHQGIAARRSPLCPPHQAAAQDEVRLTWRWEKA